MAYAVRQRRLSTNSRPRASKKFTPPQLFACLALKKFLRLDYRIANIWEVSARISGSILPFGRMWSCSFRAGDLYKDISSYMAQRIEQTPNIEALLNTQVHRMSGNDELDEIELLNKKSEEKRKLKSPALFSFIGATPRTEWLPVEIEKNSRGFVCTGPALGQSPNWTAKRQPFLLETSCSGVFAAGDVRSGSVKRRLRRWRGLDGRAVCARVSEGIAKWKWQGTGGKRRTDECFIMPPIGNRGLRAPSFTSPAEFPQIASGSK
jgi:hypothetical protein